MWNLNLYLWFHPSDLCDEPVKVQYKLKMKMRIQECNPFSKFQNQSYNVMNNHVFEVFYYELFWLHELFIHKKILLNNNSMIFSWNMSCKLKNEDVLNLLKLKKNVFIKVISIIWNIQTWNFIIIALKS